MAEEKFKLPRSSYEELTKIIKTYGTLTEPASLETVSQTVGMSPTAISANSAFLTQIEILEPGKKKQASPKGRRLAQALEFEMPDELRSAWGTVVRESDFLSRVLSAVRIRKGMDESTLVTHIAYSAGEQKKPHVLTGARAVVDILRASELIREVDGKYITQTIQETADNTNDSKESLEGVRGTSGVFRFTEEATPILVSRRSREQAQVQVNINVEVNLTCNPQDLDGLGARLREVIDQIQTARSTADAS